MTEGKPAGLILMFTLPLLAGNLFQQFYNMADTLIVGRSLGVNALAAVGCTGSVMFLIIGFVAGMTTGTSIITAQCFGAGDTDGVRRSFAANIVIAAVVSIILTAIAVPMARPILVLMKTDPLIIDDAYRYIVVIYGGIAASMLFNLLSNVVRALGDSRTPLYFLIIASILNIILDFALILGFKLGVMGASIATVVSQLVSGLLCVVYIVRRYPILHVTRKDFKLTRSEIWRHARLGLPMGFQASIIGIGVIMVQTVVNQQGVAITAAYTAAQKIEQIVLQPLSSFGMTMATYGAQNYGAGKIDRIRTGVRACAKMSLCYAVIVIVIMQIFGGTLASFVVGNEPVVIENAWLYLRNTSPLYITLSLLFIYRFTLQGLGQGVVPTIAGIMELVTRTVFVMLFVGPFGFGGVAVAYALAWPGSMIPLCIAYHHTLRGLAGSRRGG